MSKGGDGEPILLQYASRPVRGSVLPQSWLAQIGMFACLSIALVSALTVGFGKGGGLFSQTECTKENRAKAHIHVVSCGLRLYQHYYKAYPADLRLLLDESTLTDREGKVIVSGPFIDPDLGVNDPWGRLFSYQIGPMIQNKTSFDLSSAGPDGILGSADDINNW